MIAETLTVLAIADVTGLTRGMARGAEAVEKFGRETKKLAADVAQTAGAVAALGGALVAQAAKYDGQVASAVGQLQNEFNHLAVSVGKTLLPVVRDLTDRMAAAVDWFRQLSPEVKAQVVQFAQLAAAVAGMALAAQQVGNLVDAFAGFIGYILPIAPAILTVVAAVAALAAAALVLRDAWDQNFLGMRDTVKELTSSIDSNFGDVTTAMKNGMKAVGEAVLQFILYPLEKVAEVVAALSGAEWAENLVKTIGDMRARGIDGILDDVAKTGDILAGSLKRGFELAKKDVAPFADRLKAALKGLGLDKLLNPVKGKRHEQLDDPFGGRASGPALGPGAKSFADQVSDAAARIADLAETSGMTSRELGERARGLAAAWGVSEDAVIRALGEFTKGVAAQAAAQKQTATDALKGSVDNATGGIISGAMSGGFAGAAVALLQQAESFQTLMSEVTGLISIVANMLNPLIDIIRPFINVLGNVLQVLAPVVGLFLKLTSPLLMLLQVALPPFFEVVKGLGIALLFVAQGVAMVWNGIVSAFQWMITTLGDIFSFIPGVKDGMKAFADSLDVLKDHTDYQAEILKLQNMTLADATTSIAKETKQREKLNEAILNGPSGYRVNSARFDATTMNDGRYATAGATVINLRVQMDGKEMAAVVTEQQIVAGQRNGGSRWGLP